MTRAVLSQQSPDNNKWHPVAFLSKSLSLVERNCETHDKEMLATFRALEEWRHFVEGMEHQVKIWTDHKNLEYFMTAKKLNWRQACWSLLLACWWVVHISIARFGIFLKVNDKFNDLWSTFLTSGKLLPILHKFQHHWSTFHILLFCHLKTTKIPSGAPLQNLETLKMLNTKTNTSLVNRIGVQEYSRCFKEVCLILAIWKVTFHRVYIFFCSILTSSAKTI